MPRPSIWDDRRRWWALASMVACLLLIGLDTTGTFLALPGLMTSMPAANSELQWVYAGYLLAFAVLMLPLGAVADRVGRRRALVAGLALFGLASIAAALADGPAVLIAARVLMGVGAAVIMPVSLSMLPVLFPPEERARAFAIWSAGVSLGLVFGPLLAGWLLEQFWWGSVFLVNAPIVVVALVTAVWLFPESRDDHQPAPDWAGTALAAGGLLAVSYAVTAAQTRGLLDPVVLSTVVAGVALLAFAVRRQRSASNPLLPPVLREDRRFGSASLVLAVAYVVMMGLLFVLTPLLREVRGATSIGAGVQMLPLVGTLIVGAGVANRAAARAGPRAPLVAGMVLAGVGLLLLARTDNGTGTGYLAGSLAVVGSGFGLAMAAGLRAAMSAEPDNPLRIARLTTAFRQAGGAIGVAVAGSILGSAYLDGVESTVAGLPPGGADAAREQLGAAQRVADGLGGTGEVLREAAQVAYLDGMRAAVVFGAVAAFAAAALAAVLVRARTTTPAVTAAAGGVRPSNAP